MLLMALKALSVAWALAVMAWGAVLIELFAEGNRAGNR